MTTSAVNNTSKDFFPNQNSFLPIEKCIFIYPMLSYEEGAELHKLST